jgi:uroporphyrinogen decarboxylase
MPEYRKIREKVSFLDMCKRPELAAEVTLQPIDRIGVDAAILFADILLVAEPLGIGLRFEEGVGPLLDGPVRTGADVDRLSEVDVPAALGYVFEAARLVREQLPHHIPLIGFAGAPFTVAAYIIEGRSSRDFIQTKSFMYRDAGAWHALMERISNVLIDYLNGQIDAGAQAVQLFDSWIGAVSPDDYKTFVQPHVQRVVAGLRDGIPLIHFGTGTATLLDLMRDAGGNVIGLDWRIRLADGWDRVGDSVGVQGNLDPTVLFADRDEIRRRAKQVLDQAAGRPGHIFNLGHGIFPTTPVDHAIALVDAVHELSRR